FARSFGLPRVGVPQSIHETSRHVKLNFEKKCIFFATCYTSNTSKALKAALFALIEKNQFFFVAR
ncbi:MAG: hypothetical protein Q4F38_02760, partial [Akkermansia sp.]|nr:hypothetical protein [Akkermansia sp.]